MDILDLGTRDYNEVLAIQLDLLKKRIKSEIPDTLIITEHGPVVTLGRTSDDRSVDREYFSKEGIPLLATGRGGKNTFHSPGQLVLYPIVDLAGIKKDVSFYIDLLEEAVTSALRELGVPAERKGERRGVWSGGKKIAFFGVAFKRWVSFHGVSVNVNNDISAFSHMAPCGEPDIRVTSVSEIKGAPADMKYVKEVFARNLAGHLEAVPCR